ncbi:MAG: tripeptide aminopeptidase PepT, partial [Oligoflexia bacterium]|nr:tripeptide aminopeptidase PepT [Oligoflexia bacterium]
DDKAGIAAIITAVEYIMSHKEIVHGEIKIAITPDEEIGQGAKFLDLHKFGANFAYTVDGGMTINKETFSADTATIHVTGRNIHPGKAKGIMVNAIKVISAIIDRLPLHMSPETTQDYAPFLHPMDLTVSVSNATLKLILRDFLEEGLDAQKHILEVIIAEVQKIYPVAKIQMEITESYRNMRKKLDENPLCLELLSAAVAKTGVAVDYAPIRGGTDGATLTALGLPTPNLFYGGENAHSLSEWVSVDIMEKSMESIINIITLAVNHTSTHN